AASPMPPRSSDKDALHGIACRLVGGAGTPTDGRLVKAPTAPPSGIAPGRMHGAFHAARKALTRLVGRNEQTFTMSGARVVKVQLLWIRSIVRQRVLDRTLRPDRLKPS